MPARPWSIRQITSASPKSIVLGDSAAPHGRPRHGALVTDGIVLRHSATYYPGSNVPTRHTFGVRHEDFVLQGRWMDSQLGAGGANANATLLKQMVRDELPVRVEWGEVVAATGLILGFHPARESDAEIAWKIVIGIDNDDELPPRQQPLVPSNPKSQLDEALRITAAFPGSASFPREIPFNYPSNLLESIDTLVSSINTFTASLSNIVNAIDDFDRASAVELHRIRSTVGAIAGYSRTLVGILGDATNDGPVAAASALARASFSATLAQQRTDAVTLLALLAEIDAEARRALAGRTDTTVRAQGGDSWESISLARYGAVDGADALRQANNARGGKKPQPGRPIHVPRR